jgi:NADPH:quinone reductase-like Zn-dependent oxidoreductase
LLLFNFCCTKFSILSINLPTVSNSPIKFLMSSRALIGLNMLAIADRKPHAIERSMKGVLDLYEKGIFKTMVGETYTVDEIAKAHTKLEKGQTMGKIAIEWQ